jgi:hypothetical protein
MFQDRKDKHQKNRTYFIRDTKTIIKISMFILLSRINIERFCLLMLQDRKDRYKKRQNILH